MVNAHGHPMQTMRLALDDELYWWLFAEAARTRTKAHEVATQILKSAFKAAAQPELEPSNGGETAA